MSNPPKRLKLVIYVDVAHADLIRKTLAEVGAGHIGNYDACSFSVPGIGRFRPLEGSNPTIGEAGKLEVVEEERIETICYETDAKRILEKIRSVHPYEEPAIDVYELREEFT